MKLTKFAILLAVLLMTGMVFLSTSRAQSAAKPDGEALFKGKCSMCHGPDGKGYPAIKTPDFTSPKWQASVTDQQIMDTIKNGKKGTAMMAFGNQLDDAQIEALKDYIRSLNSEKKK
ncbi:MAG: c-type cytochrome [Terriglobia bacterium]